MLRQFCRIYAAPVPDDTTLLRGANLLHPATLQQWLEHVGGLARSLKITPGRQLRIDGTVVSTTIHHPTDSPLRYEGVRVLSRTLTKAKQVVQQAASVARRTFREHTRSAKRQLKRLMEAARQRGAQADERMRTAYQQLLALTTATVAQAERASAILTAQTTPTGHKLAATLRQFIPLVQRVITQPTRRILQGESVPALEKVVSLFEPHTAIIRKGKPGKPTELGRVLWWDEVEGGIISRYAVLEGNPAEDVPRPPSLDHHRRAFNRPPRWLAGARGVHSTANEQYAITHGVKQVVLPKPGTKSAKRMAHEQQRWFRRGHNWRAGIEGRIRGLKRRHKLDRCRYHGTVGMERGVGWGVITHHLRVIAQATAHEPARTAIQPYDGLIGCETWDGHTIPYGVLHRNLVLRSIHLTVSSFSSGEDMQINQVRYEYLFFTTQPLRVSVYTPELPSIPSRVNLNTAMIPVGTVN